MNRKDYMKDYYKRNQQEILDKKKKYYIENRESIMKKRAELKIKKQYGFIEIN